MDATGRAHSVHTSAFRSVTEDTIRTRVACSVINSSGDLMKPMQNHAAHGPHLLRLQVFVREVVQNGPVPSNRPVILFLQGDPCNSIPLQAKACVLPASALVLDLTLPHKALTAAAPIQEALATRAHVQSMQANLGSRPQSLTTVSYSWISEGQGSQLPYLHLVCLVVAHHRNRRTT